MLSSVELAQYDQSGTYQVSLSIEVNPDGHTYMMHFVAIPSGKEIMMQIWEGGVQ